MVDMVLQQYGLCPDALLQRRGEAWIFSNPRTRSHVEVNVKAALAIMNLAGGASESIWIQSLSDAQGWERTQFTNSAGLMEDSSGCGSSRESTLIGGELFSALRRAWILHAKECEDYKRFLAPRTSLLDDAHLGTFHQRLGHYLLLDCRLKETWQWWHNQKFSPDGLSVRPGAYKWIQEYFFSLYFGRKNMKGLALLDFACGNGYYARRFADLGAKVTGIDTSADLIAIAKKNHGHLVNFVQPTDDAACQALLDSYPKASFDRIYVSDALLFFFHDLKSGQRRELLPSLLRGFRHLLKKDGLLYVMEPNGAFWLSVWMGDPSRPLPVVTEYREQIYQVAPTIDQVISEFSKAGFLVADLIHPPVDLQAEAGDSPVYAFARSFPLWDFYVCVPDTRGL